MSGFLQGRHTAQAVAHHHRRAIAHHLGQILDLVLELTARTRRQGSAVAATVVAHHLEVGEEPGRSGERRAAIQRAVHQNDAGGAHRPGLLRYEEVCHAGAR